MTNMLIAAALGFGAIGFGAGLIVGIEIALAARRRWPLKDDGDPPMGIGA